MAGMVAPNEDELVERMLHPIRKPESRLELVKQLKRRVCVVVLGMHRSGTSALSGILGLLGASLPKNMVASNPSNPKGFFEPHDIVLLHDEMLSEFGSSWIDFRPLNASTLDSEAGALFKAKLVAALEDNYGHADQLILKDPRICRFFPYWRDLIDSLGMETRVVIMIRNPLEVASSLAKRDELSQAYSLNLWLRHVLDAEFGSRGSTRTFIKYSALMDDWKSVIDKIETEIGVEFSERTREVQAVASTLIDQELRHYTVDEAAIAVECRDNPLVLKAYRALETLVERSDDRRGMSALDEVRASFDEATRAFGSFAADLVSSQSRLYFARHRIEVLEAQAANLQAQITESATRVAGLEQHRRLSEDNLNKLDRMLAAQDTLLAQRQNEIARLKAQLGDVQGGNESDVPESAVLPEAEEQLRIITSSLSWRMGKPARWLNAKIPWILRAVRRMRAMLPNRTV